VLTILIFKNEIKVNLILIIGSRGKESLIEDNYIKIANEIIDFGMTLKKNGGEENPQIKLKINDHLTGV
jgi:hypothetical protein